MALTNFLKALAIIAVVGLHVLSLQPQTGYILDLNLIFRFCVPLFVALSGFGLAKSFSSHVAEIHSLPGTLKLLRDYYVRRVLRLIPWYLFWGAIIYWYIYHIGQGPDMYGNMQIWVLFVLGRIDYHLYFVPMIVELYLLFPLLWLAVKKFPHSILFTALLWQLYWYNAIPSSGLSDQQQYVQAGSWIFYFVLGIYLAQIPKLLSRSPAFLLSCFFLFAGLIWTIFQAQSQQHLGEDPIIFTRFTQIPVLLYSTGFILSGFLILPKFLSKLSYFPTALLTTLGELSYLVYLNHTLVLRILSRPPFNLAQSNFWLLFAATVTVSFLISKLADLGSRRLLGAWQNLHLPAGIQN